MTFARDVRVAGRQTTSDRDRPPARPPGPASLVQELGASVGNRSLARLIATANLARQPRKRRDPTTADIEKWAKWPNEAHQQWKRLGVWERASVFESMRRRYGKDFAEQFRKYAETGKADLDTRVCEMPVCMPEPFPEAGVQDG